MKNRILPPKKDLYPNGICSKHLKAPIPCILQNFHGRDIKPYLKPGVRVIYMCPDCWKNFQERMKRKIVPPIRKAVT